MKKSEAIGKSDSRVGISDYGKEFSKKPEKPPGGEDEVNGSKMPSK